jgi:hypothetical protein
MRKKQGRQTMVNKANKHYGSLRTVNLVEAYIVLASGVYITFRLAKDRTLQQHLVEVDRTRVMGQKMNLEIHPTVYREIRAAAFQAIMRHRSHFRLPAPPIEHRYTKPHQLQLPLVSPVR